MVHVVDLCECRSCHASQLPVSVSLPVQLNSAISSLLQDYQQKLHSLRSSLHKLSRENAMYPLFLLLLRMYVLRF